MEDSPSVGLYHAVGRGDSSEWILLCLARDKGAGLTTFIFSDDDVEN